MTISLSKGQVISLDKQGSGISRLRMGLGWDPVKKKAGLFGMFGGGGGEIDLDASCIVLNAAGAMVDIIWFRQLTSKDGSIVHGGDNLTGDGDGDDEVIKVDTARVSSNASHLVFTVNSFRGQTFDEVENAVCRIVDDSAGKGAEICRYTLAEKGRHTGVVMGVLSRVAGGWAFKAVGAPAEGRTADDMARDAARHL